ncbi:DMT family transporter [Jatrophihabitans sp. YIM 134969]
MGAATAYAIAANLKHVSAGQVPDAGNLSGQAVARFVRATITHRLWLLSIVVDLVGASLQILALRRGALSVVQPLLVSGLVIALVLRAGSGGRVRRAEIVWGAVLAATLGAFLVVAGVGPTGRGVGTSAVDVRPAVAVAACGLLLVGSCVVVARRRRGRGGSAVVLGVAVGLVNASTAAMLKSLTTIARHGVLAVGASWQLYVLVGLVAAAMFLNQLAFQSGPLSASLPVIASVDPLASVAIGVVVFDEAMRNGALASAALVALSGVLVAAVTALTRSSTRVAETPRPGHVPHPVGISRSS